MIKAILFDSGNVLNYPTSGNWFISPHFYDFVNQQRFQGISRPKIHHAFQRASQYINGIPTILDKSEELAFFTEFYRILFSCLPELEIDKNKLKRIAEDLVYTPQKYTFFSDALTVIPILSKKCKLGIVSDAWPSILDVYENAGLLKYFSTFIISSVLGTHKPDRIMYEAALKELEITPAEAIFIDDNPVNCKGAKKAGIASYLLCRNPGKAPFLKLQGKLGGYQIIDSLNTLTDFLA